MNKLLITFLMFCASANASITPEINLPANFDNTQFKVYIIKKSSSIQYTQQNDSCNDVKYKNFFPSDKYTNSHGELPPEKNSFSQWLCLYAVDIYEGGFAPILKESVFYSKDKLLWTIKRSKKRDITPPYLNKSYIPIELYNISSPNAKGFAIISRNILESDREEFNDDLVKKIIYFCMIRDSYALCGKGSLVHNIDGKEIDFTPYALKSLESMEIGVK